MSHFCFNTLSGMPHSLKSHNKLKEGNMFNILNKMDEYQWNNLYHLQGIDESRFSKSFCLFISKDGRKMAHTGAKDGSIPI
jgi:hypothetical protein